MSSYKFVYKCHMIFYELPESKKFHKKFLMKFLMKCCMVPLPFDLSLDTIDHIHHLRQKIV